MLRDGDHYAAAGFSCLMHLTENCFIFLNVLDYIESTNDVELVFERDSPRIHLEKHRLWYSLGGTKPSLHKRLHCLPLSFPEMRTENLEAQNRCRILLPESFERQENGFGEPR